ncbi:MAG TPA: saccharopine dehydrogenase C-terminal domain-containing protein [Vicinamibacterales bacterium]|nr:saccharopine dehydrogenase C-terminal domain-containing protein [Vicinamibacterales bacterium]
MIARRVPAPSIAVVGGAGAMGRITVRDLVETAPAGVDLIVADRDLAAARRLVRPFGGRVRAVRIDASRPAATARALRGTGVLVNACHHSFNLAVMRAALAIGSHYCDLGGLFHVTREQLRLTREFARAGRLALCGIGSAPGIVNVMARSAVEPLDTVRAIDISVGTIDRRPADARVPLASSYSIQTVLEEASAPAAVFVDGRLRFVDALSGAVPVEFPEPVGRRFPVYTLHSELATLPVTYRSRGIRDVSFRIAFPGDLADRLRFVRSLGLLSTAPVRVGHARVVPRAVLLALLAAQPKRPVTATEPDEYEVLRVVVRGSRGGVDVEEVLDCHVPGMPAWGIGVDIDTGAPPSIVAQMLLRGEVSACGVLPPERAVPPEPFFRELALRGMRIVRRDSSQLTASSTQLPAP